TDISDNLHEWQRRDSAAFTQPYDPQGVQMAYFYNTAATFNYTRISAFVQDNIRFDSANKFTANVGARINYSFLNQEFIVSPRLQFAYKPNWSKDWIFKFSAGEYAQPPFYREMRL